MRDLFFTCKKFILCTLFLDPPPLFGLWSGVGERFKQRGSKVRQQTQLNKLTPLRSSTKHTLTAVDPILTLQSRALGQSRALTIHKHECIDNTRS
jgi:hypothetical protein